MAASRSPPDSATRQRSPYQADVRAKIADAIGSGYRRILLPLPTGAGKTVVGAEIIRGEVENGRTVLFLVHRRELTKQTSRKLHDVGIDGGIIQAGFAPRPGQPVQIASVQTLHARAVRTRTIELPAADVVIVDEAHHVRARTYARILEQYPHAIIIGLTATPCRGDGRGLGNAFDVIIECPTVQELIEGGYLVGTKVYAPSRPDLTGVRVERGDYNEFQLAERMNTKQLVGDVVEHWHRLAERRRTVVFATGVGHSVHLRDEFRRSGVLAEHIDGATPIEERDAILARLERGEIEVVCNCMVLTEGWDQPPVACLVLARPTKSLGLYRQMVGRVLRPAPGKDHALILDHAGATFAHGFAEDPIVWTLREDRKAMNPKHAARGTREMPRLCECPECCAVMFEGRGCSVCGWRPRPKPEAFETQDGELGELRRDRKVVAFQHDEMRFYRMLRYIAINKGRNPKSAAWRFKDKFGRFPPLSWNDQPPLEPSDDVRSWSRSRDIAYAKAMQKKEGAA